MFDTHIHINSTDTDVVQFKKRLKKAGVSEAVLFSLSPECFFTAKEKLSPEKRLDNLMELCEGDENLHPFFWIDPIAGDAEEQVSAALKRKVSGFKVICDRFYPSDKRAMAVFKMIAGSGKPILFHSGILWDGKVSSKYNHPIEFECLLDVPKLRFALAHVSWPWCDELIALYGKILNAYSRNPEISVEMFVDTTPGTPVIYRKSVLEKLYTVGYDVEHNIIFGSDSQAGDYNAKWVSEWHKRDLGILRALKIPESTINNYFSRNGRRFLGLDKAKISKKSPVPGK